MKKVLQVICWMIAALAGRAQTFHVPAESVYMNSGACSEHFSDAFSFTANPAVLGDAEDFRMGLSTERKWMLKELDFEQLACSFPAGGGGLGFQLHYTGDAGYSESSLAVDYGKRLGRAGIGGQFRYDAYHAAGYGTYSNGSLAFGLRFHPAENLYAGLVLSIGLFGGAGNVNPEKPAEHFSMGFGYEASGLVLISLQFVKEAGSPMNVVAGIDYRWAGQFFASTGVDLNSASPFARAGWQKNGLRFVFFTAYHTALGFTPGLALFWEDKKKSG